jgi:hypothetical protein
MHIAAFQEILFSGSPVENVRQKVAHVLCEHTVKWSGDEASLPVLVRRDEGQLHALTVG